MYAIQLPQDAFGKVDSEPAFFLFSTSTKNGRIDTV